MPANTQPVEVGPGDGGNAQSISWELRPFRWSGLFESCGVIFVSHPVQRTGKSFSFYARIFLLMPLDKPQAICLGPEQRKSFW